MREITKIMIKKYALNQLKYDFMAYPFTDTNELSFHHLIIPRRLSNKNGLLDDGYVQWNGAILGKNTSHQYLHIIEHYNPAMFADITSEMIDQNIKGYLDMRNLMAINEILEDFEKEYSDVMNKKGQPLIKEEYLDRILRR